MPYCSVHRTFGDCLLCKTQDVALKVEFKSRETNRQEEESEANEYERRRQETEINLANQLRKKLRRKTKEGVEIWRP